MLEAKVYNMKSLLTSGLKRLGASEMASKILWKDSFSVHPQLKIASFLIIFCKGRMISKKLAINLLTKFILLTNDCIAFFLEG